MEIEKLIEQAVEARKQSYSPYSHFQVGACLEAENGEVFCGCNIENASYPATVCAERTAFFQAVAKGVRRFRRIVIVGGREGGKLTFCPPCGICRQVMAEFCDPEQFEIVLPRSREQYETYLLKELLPLGFSNENM